MSAGRSVDKCIRRDKDGEMQPDAKRAFCGGGCGSEEVVNILAASEGNLENQDLQAKQNAFLYIQGIQGSPRG